MLFLFHIIIKIDNKMKYIDLISKIDSSIFSLQDLRLLNEKVYPYQLSQWVKKGYLFKLKNGLFIFSERSKNIKMETIAFNLYQPSYVSLEWVLAKYGLIPEMTYNLTSITSKTTRSFKNKFGEFTFRNIKKSMFFGYEKVEENEQVYLMAYPEKALIDYIYLNMKKIKNEDDIRELRLNDSAIKELDMEKIEKYTDAINNKKLTRTLDTLLC